MGCLIDLAAESRNRADPSLRLSVKHLPVRCHTPVSPVTLVMLVYTSVVVTHDMKLARKLADKVVFLVDGRVTFFGPINELDASPEPIVRDFIRLDEVSFLQNSGESIVESREFKNQSGLSS